MEINETGGEKEAARVQFFGPRPPAGDRAESRDTAPLRQQISLYNGIFRNYPGISDYQTVCRVIHGFSFTLMGNDDDNFPLFQETPAMPSRFRIGPLIAQTGQGREFPPVLPMSL
jgi:hypothetical protein